MKKKLVMLLLAALSTTLVACGGKTEEAGKTEETGKISLQEASTDSISKASTKTFYAESALTGDELFESINKREGAVTIATTNPDGSPNLAVAVPGALDGKYLMFGLAPNQTLENLKSQKLAVVSYYIYNPQAEDKFERNRGAKLVVKYVEDENKIKELREKAGDKASDTTSFLEIVEVKPLG